MFDLRRTVCAAFDFVPHDSVIIDEIAASLEVVELQRDQVLCREGDEADCMYVLVRGQLAALPADPEQPPFGVFGAGRLIGTWALITDGVRTADVVALRPSHVGRLSRRRFEQLTLVFPELLGLVAREAVHAIRARQSDGGAEPGPTVIAVLPLEDGSRYRSFVDQLERGLRIIGPCRRIGESGLVQTASGEPGSADEALRRSLAIERQLDAAEGAADSLLLVGTSLVGPWTERIIQRADRVVLVANADGSPALRPGEPVLPASTDPRLPRSVSLVLVHGADTPVPRKTAAWLEPRELDLHLHVREDRPQDCERVARLLTGHGIGLVLSGGAALGAAHIGAIAALCERGVPVDYLGGTSAGGGIAAIMALQLDYEAIHDVTVEHFIETNPIGRPTLPLMSLVAGAPLDRTAKQMFGDLEIEDLWLPWFGVTASLSSGQPKVLRRGAVWLAVRATSSVPGLMPPVVHEGELLVDGGVLDNFPSLTMRRLCGGKVIGSDAQAQAEARKLEILHEDVPGPLSMLWDRLRGRKSKVRLPGIGAVMTRVATLGHRASYAQQREACEVYLKPSLRSFGMRDFKRFAQIAAIGYEHAVEALDSMDIGELVPGWGAEERPGPSHAAPALDRGPAAARFGLRRAPKG